MTAMKVLFLLLAASSMAAVEAGQQPRACAAKLSPCLNYLNSTSPPESCCTPLKTEVKNDLPCLCTLLNNPSHLKASQINITQVLQLLKQCGITADTSICKTAVGAPSVKLQNPVIGSDGKIFTCSGKDLIALQSNGSVAWIISLTYICDEDIPPVIDESGTMYLIAEDKILKVNPLHISEYEQPVEILFSLNATASGSPIVSGLSISTSYSALLVNIRNRGLFAFSLHGQMMWSVGPMLYRFGYRQGCKGNLKECYFSSGPVVDQCEGTLYITNSQGQVYSLYIHSPHFRWIQDFSSVDLLMTITPGNNGRLYVIFPRKALMMSLDAYTGNLLWQSSIGPLSTQNINPVVDSNGWVSIGSLDGLLYSFSPTGEMRKFFEATAVNSVIQASPILDCSGFAAYISQTEMESKDIRVVGNYSYVSATNPIKLSVTLLSPATGTVYWTRKFSGELSSLLPTMDSNYFVMDENFILAILASARIGSKLPCYSTKQKLDWTCAQGQPQFININTGNERVIVVFVLLQLAVLVVLAAFVRFCYLFWRKKKLQDHGLGRFLEKRRSLHEKRKAYGRMITELEQEASAGTTSVDAFDKLKEVAKAKAGIERKLLTSYSLTQDRVRAQRGSVLLPLYNSKRHLFRSARQESLTVFNTISDYDTASSSSGNVINNSTSESSTDDISDEAGPSSRTMVPEQQFDIGQNDQVLASTMFSGNRHDEITELKPEAESMTEPTNRCVRRRMWLKRRTLSSTN